MSKKLTLDAGDGPFIVSAPANDVIDQPTLQLGQYPLRSPHGADHARTFTDRASSSDNLTGVLPDLGEVAPTLAAVCDNFANASAANNFAAKGSGCSVPSCRAAALRDPLFAGVGRIIDRVRFEPAAPLLLVLFLLFLANAAELNSSAALLRRTPTSNARSSAVASVMIVTLLCAARLQRAGAADVPVRVDPSTGVDSSSCGTAPPCKTVAYAIQSRNASTLYLSPGNFSEPVITISGSAVFVNITGSGGSTVFDRSPGTSPGPAFSIANAAVAISGVTFRSYANFDVLNGTGGAVSASGSNLTVCGCSFFNNMAQTGGAIGVASGSLAVSSSSFQNNTATCPNAASTTKACSAWGGAIGAVEARSVLLTGSTFSSNAVNLVLNNVTSTASQAVAGGGCVSVLHNFNVSESTVVMSGNVFQSCLVRMFGVYSRTWPLPTILGIQYGNSYGGAVSLYYGLRAADSLDVQNVISTFTNNSCRSSGIVSSVGVAGNAHGGCISVYAGAWSVSTAGASTIGPLSVSGMRSNISGNNFSDCSARIAKSSSYDLTANVYGGCVSVAVGAYSYSISGSSRIAGSTLVSSANYTISSNTFTGCSAVSLVDGGGGSSKGANVYGGGFFQWSLGRTLGPNWLWLRTRRSVCASAFLQMAECHPSLLALTL